MKGGRRHSADPVAAVCCFGLPPLTPSPPSQRASSKCAFCLTFPCTAFLRSTALVFSAWPFPSPNTHLSTLVLSHLCSPQISHDGEIPLKPSGNSDQKHLEEPKISVEWQVTTCEVSRACRELGPSAAEGRKPESWSLAPWEVRRWKVKQPWCIGSAQGKRWYLLWSLLPGTRLLLPSSLPDSRTESLQHYMSCPCFVLNQPSPNAA